MTVKQQFVFNRKVARFSDGRLIITVPPEVARFLHPRQVYEVVMRPVGTLVVVRT